MIPFLFDDIKGLLISLCSRVVKPDKEMSIKMLCLLHFENETNLLHVYHIDIGFVAKSAIKASRKASRQKIEKFYYDAKTFVIGIIQKII